jgi:hypothetical protein
MEANEKKTYEVPKKEPAKEVATPVAKAPEPTEKPASKKVDEPKYTAQKAANMIGLSSIMRYAVTKHFGEKKKETLSAWRELFSKTL